MGNCIFCKIIEHEIPANIVYEDKEFLSFLTIEPISDGHLLIIPKGHVEWMQDASDETIAGIFILSKKLMRSLIKAFGCDYVSVSVAGKDVPHFHVHLNPRFYNDGLKGWPTKKYQDNEGEAIAKKIISAL